MDMTKLVKMANEIGRFFEVEPDRDVAVEGVAGHLLRFWEPRMRRELLAFVEQGHADKLTPLVREAVTKNRERLTPKQT
jgi:formate dehydrogenase subunit delta